MDAILENATELQKVYRTNPGKFFREVLNETLWREQEEICNMIVANRDSAVKSGHGIGKSRCVAGIVLWWLCSYYPSKVITTAPTFLQVEKIIWSELKTIYNKTRFPIGGSLIKTELRLGDNWYALGISTDEADRVQGHHSPNLLVIIDEASGVTQPIWEGIDGLVTGTNNKRLAIGNPLSPIGRFYDCFKSTNWAKKTVSCLSIPNYIIQRENALGLEECRKFDPKYKSYKELGLIEVPGLTGYDWVEARRAEWDEGNPLWSSKVLGEFPVETENTLIPLSWIEHARVNETDLPAISKGLGVDVARGGTAEGIVDLWDGVRIKQFIIKTSDSRIKVTKTAQKIIEIIREESLDRNIPIAIDDTGVGGGVSDILSDQGYNVIPAIMKARADTDDKYFDLRSEIFWDVRNIFRNSAIIIPKDDEKLAGQLASLMYETDRHGRIKLVSKEKMLKDGFESPDRADALALAVYSIKGTRGRGIKIKGTSHMIATGGAGGY